MRHEGGHGMLLLSLGWVSASGAASHRQQIRETLAVIGNLVIMIIELLHILNLSSEGIRDKRFFFLVM